MKIKKEKEKKAHLNDEKLFREYSETKDLQIRNKIAENNQALVTYIVHKYYSSRKEHKEHREDLLQEGNIGLLAAIDGYNINLGYRFSTYATWWIRQSVNNFLISIEPMIHVPSHVRTQQNKVIRKLKAENKTLESLIERGNTKTNKMVNSIRHAINSKHIISIDKPLSRHDGNIDGADSLKDLLPSNEASLEDHFDKSRLVKIFKNGLKTLSDRERYILLLRYNVITKENINQKGP